MNKKKCPKCGEENPTEAVMCWACYTLLSGESNVAGSTPGGAKAATDSGEEKKKIPPWQLAVIGVALLGGLFLGARTMMTPPSDGEEEETPTTETADDPKKTDDKEPETTPAAPASAPSAPPPAGTAVPAPQEAPFTVVVPPNPRLSVATMAIVPTDGTATGPQAAALAAYTRRQFKGNTKQWSSLYIYVFSDAQSAQYFAEYMKRRKGATLAASDYSYLSNLWGSVLTRYEYTTYKGKRVERALYPSKNPNGWWNQRATS